MTNFPTKLFIIGLTMLVLGYAYHTLAFLMAMQSSTAYDTHTTIAGIIMGMGSVMFIVGFLLWLVRPRKRN